MNKLQFAGAEPRTIGATPAPTVDYDDQARAKMRDRWHRLTEADAPEWADLRLPARTRLAAACAQLIDTGILQRADIMRIGEVSLPQASLDIRAILAAAPEFMTYDKVNRCYRHNMPSD
jgi:hypothetical protein